MSETIQTLKPMSLLRELVDLLSPALDTSNQLTPSLKLTERELRDMLLPYFGDYTVADAVLMIQILRAVGCRSGWGSANLDEDAEGEILFRVGDLLSGFVAVAAASGPMCVEMRAELIEQDHPDRPVFYDAERRKVARRLCTDVGMLRAGSFDGHLFRDDMWLEDLARADEIAKAA